MPIRKLFFTLFPVLLSLWASAQVSLLTDISLMRNRSPQQKFWAAGQFVHVNFYAHDKGGPYAWVGYYLNGRFTNRTTAFAKNLSTAPAAFDYTVRSTWKFRQLSLGWKQYFKGTYRAEDNWNLYGYAGFGLLFARMENAFSRAVDTAAYFISNPRSRSGKFNRLTYDLGLGAEVPIGADVYLYSELRAMLQSSDTPSPLLVRNKRMPEAASLHGGIRILIQ